MNRKEAEQIARNHLAATGFPVDGVEFVVRTPAEYGRVPIYASRSLEQTLDNSWLVFVNEAELGLKNSWLVVISRTDGAILYSGAAEDEG